MFTETIGMTLAEIIDFLLAHGYSVTVIPETEDECGCVTTRTSEYGEGFDFSIMGGVVDEYEFVDWA